MELYGYKVNETSPSMQQKAYYSKVHADMEVYAQKLNYYGSIYIKKGSIKQVLSDAMEDRKKMLEPAVTYLSRLLTAQKLYMYTTEDILTLCDGMSGHFMDAYIELCEDFCEITGQEEKERELRELRKQARTRVGAIGSDIPSLAMGALKAGTINAVTGIAHSVINVVGNALSALGRMDKLSSMYESSYVWTLLQDGMRADCRYLDRVLAALFANVLGPEWRYPFSDVRIKEIKSIAEKIRDKVVPVEEWPQTIVACIINGAPYWSELYEFAEVVLGSDSGNLLHVARFFSVYPYIEKCERKERMINHEQQRKTAEQNFFGVNLEDAKAFFDDSDVFDTLYREIADTINPDFNRMLSILNGERHFYIHGKDTGPIFESNTRRHLILFGLDFSLIQRERELKRYCALCHLTPQKDEIPYYFLDTTNFCTRKSGIIATNYGFYLSNPHKDNPLLYRHITTMKGGMLDSMDIFYNGKSAKVNLPPINQTNNLLVLTCMYFKYGIFKKVMT